MSDSNTRSLNQTPSVSSSLSFYSLLDIVHAARVAETLDELVKLREADGVLSRTIRQVEASRRRVGANGVLACP